MEYKSKILYLLKLLYQKTDEEHPLSTNEIIDELAKIDITVGRKKVADDIALLEEFGVDIIKIRSTANKYFIGSRTFEIPEIKLLIDAVESSKLVTSKKSKDLISKLVSIVSENQSTSLRSNLYVDKRIKPQNEEIYYSIDTINKAIDTNMQIEFNYIDYRQDKSTYYKHQGYTYKLSPYSLVWNGDYYYVVGYCKKHNGISKFRVDRMAKVVLTDNLAVIKPEDFHISDFVKNVFDMYDGKTQKVELKCENQLMKTIIDRFGHDVEVHELGSNCFKAIVDISVSPTFFGWLFGFGSKISILAPETVKEGYSTLLKSALDEI